MYRSIFLFVLITLLIGCQSSTNSNVNTANSNANLPPEFSTSPIPPSSNTTPGIPPANQAVNAMPRGTTPTPGIPAANKTLKPGTTPTPGIPDQETIRRQMQGLERPNVNANSARTPGDNMMRPMKKKTPTPQ